MARYGKWRKSTDDRNFGYLGGLKQRCSWVPPVVIGQPSSWGLALQHACATQDASGLNTDLAVVVFWKKDLNERWICEWIDGGFVVILEVDGGCFGGALAVNGR